MVNNKNVILKSILVMALWGSLFPSVKCGYSAFKINTEMFPSLLLFAGMRFAVCGLILLVFCLFKKEPMKVSGSNSIWQIVSVSLFAVILHYSCTYIGLTMVDSSKTALLKQLGVLFFICFSFLFFKEDKFSIKKIVSALLGILGIVVLNTQSLKFSFGMGEILIVGASFCTVISNISGKKLTQKISPLIMTGYSQLLGGIVLVIVGIGFGGRIHELSGSALFVFSYICTASMISYCIWYDIIKENHLSQLFIIKFLEPLFAGLFGAFLLQENIFNMEYLIALVLTFAAIWISNSTARKKQS